MVRTASFLSTTGRKARIAGRVPATEGEGMFGGWENSGGTSYWKLQCGEQRVGRGGPQNDPRHFSKSQRKVMALQERAALYGLKQSSLQVRMEREKPGVE